MSDPTIKVIPGIAGPSAPAGAARSEDVKAMSAPELAAWIEHCKERLIATDMQ